MSKLTAPFLAILISLLFVKFFQWPVPYYVVADPLYGTLSLNYANLAIDIFVLFLINMVVFGLLQLIVFFLVTKSLLKELKREKDTNAV